MSGFNGSGTFNISGVGLPYTSGTTISSSVANQLNTDLATGLSTCITKDGQSTVTANIGWNNFNINNLSALGIGTASPTGKMEVKSGSTTNFIIDSSGNVGIGTSSPVSKLDVNNDATSGVISTIWASNVSASQVNIGIGVVTAGRPFIGTNTNTNPLEFGTRGNSDLVFLTNTTERMRIDSSGNVGIGSSSPDVKLLIETSASNAIETALTLRNSGTGNGTGSAIKFGYGDSSTNLYGARITAYGYPSSVRPYSIGFERANGSGTGWDQSMVIDSSGHVLIGTTGIIAGSNANLEVYQGGGTDTIVAQNTSSSANILACWNSASSGNNVFITFYTDTGTISRGQISYNRGAGLTNYGQTSDYRAKTVNGLIENALDKVTLLKPSTGRMNGADSDIDFFVAHELQEVVPYAVIGKKDAVKTEKYEVSPEIKDDQGNVIAQAVIGTREVPEYQMVDKSALIPLLTAAIQELKAELDIVKTELAALKGS